jgi:hypothetical protein
MVYKIKKPWELREITIHGQVTIGCYETFDNALTAKVRHDKSHSTASIIYDTRTGLPQAPCAKSHTDSARLFRVYGTGTRINRGD